MPTPREIAEGRGGGTVLPGAGPEPDNRILGFWWSDADWRWWPYYLGEARESTGNGSLGSAEAKLWADANGFTLSPSVSRGKERPTNDSFIYSDTGRAAPTSGSGRSGGASAAYVPQDPARVKDQVRSYVVAVTGTNNDEVVAAGIKAWDAADRAGFDKRDSQGVDPWEAVKAAVRESEAYKTVNALRPDSVDEMDWVTSRQALLRNLGVSAQRAEEVGIETSAAGASGEAVAMAGTVAQSIGAGRQLEFMRDRIKSSARAALGVV